MTVEEKKTKTDVSRMTPTQRKIYNLLLDHCWHPLWELHKCLWDEQSNPRTVASHLSDIRPLLVGEVIVCYSKDGVRLYRLVYLDAFPNGHGLA